MGISSRHLVAAALIAAAVLSAACTRHAASGQTEHIRGVIESRDEQSVTVSTATGSVHLQLDPSTHVATVEQADRSHIASGSFLGIASATQPDGSQRAVEVTVFPESMRGTGEGHYDWDVPAASGGAMTNGAVSKMTNGTVTTSKMTNGTVATQPGGSKLTLHYKDAGATGSQTIDLPADIPVVLMAPGELADLQLGAHVFVVAHRGAGNLLVATRITVGKNGIVPPM